VTVVGLTVSLVGDLSSGPLVIGAYAVALVIVSAVIAVVRARDRARALRQTLAIALAFAVCFGLLALLGRAIGSRYHGHAHAHADATPTEPAHHEAVTTSTAQTADRPESPAEAGEGKPAARQEGGDLAARFEACDDPADQADIVCEALQTDPASGAALALRYLAGGPPLFFAQTVVDELDALLPRPSGFDVEQPFAGPVNQEAAEHVRAEFGIR
jgi:hypothetical protein